MQLSVNADLTYISDSRPWLPASSVILIREVVSNAFSVLECGDSWVEGCFWNPSSEMLHISILKMPMRQGMETHPELC